MNAPLNWEHAGVCTEHGRALLTFWEFARFAPIFLFYVRSLLTSHKILVKDINHGEGSCFFRQNTLMGRR